MVKISLSGSGEGPGRVTGRGYSTSSDGGLGSSTSPSYDVYPSGRPVRWTFSGTLAQRRGVPKHALVDGVRVKGYPGVVAEPTASSDNKSGGFLGRVLV